jgi:hypothetical protein
MPKYPDIRVKLSGTNGNALCLVGVVSGALRRSRAAPADVDTFCREALRGDYDNVLRTCCQWVAVS